MKKYTWLVKMSVPLIVLVAVGITFAARPRLLSFSPAVPAVKEKVDSMHRFTPEEEQSLRGVIGFYAHLDSCRDMFVEGTLHALDQADSTATLKNGFRFCKRGDELYYQLGEMEMLSLKDVYVTISHSAKKILVSPPKKLLPPFQLPVDSMINLWQQENYRVTSSSHDDVAAVSLLCPDHAVCKEYRFVFDTSGRTLHELYMRLTNLSDPLNTAMDKEIRVSITQWREQRMPVQLLKADNYLLRKQHTWVPAAAYRDYELISLF